MKRLVSLLLSAALLAGLAAGCRQEPAAGTEPPAGLEGPAALEVVNAVFPRCGYGEGSGDVEYLTGDEDGKEFLAAYLSNAYDLQDAWEDAAVIRGLGASAFELAVLRMEDEGAAVRAATALMTYIFERQGDFAGYAPDQADMAANGSVNQRGPYAALFICPDTDGADGAFLSALEGMEAPASLAPPEGSSGPDGAETSAPPEPAQSDPAETVNPPQSEPPEPAQTAAPPDPTLGPDNWQDPNYPDRFQFARPGKEDMSLYDTSAIRAAWAKGDPAGLSEYDRAIYDGAAEVLGQALRDGMGALEKETAIYHWIVNHVDYDWRHQDVMAVTPRESYTPYGGLVEGTAVCLGYATTFQLLCDLAGVECITVVGAAHYSRNDHAWNMVRLDGDWYCVDVTWDANYREQGMNSGREQDWHWFNVTSRLMADTNHQWDYANTPEAVTDSGRG